MTGISLNWSRENIRHTGITLTFVGLPIIIVEYVSYVVITRWTTGGYDIFITCPAKSMHREPEGLEVHAFCGTGDENVMPTCREAGN